jgi:branched-subunit amino acid transport protein AzlD
MSNVVFPSFIFMPWEKRTFCQLLNAYLVPAILALIFSATFSNNSGVH